MGRKSDTGTNKQLQLLGEGRVLKQHFGWTGGEMQGDPNRRILPLLRQKMTKKHKVISN